jgi:AcrR family transcriptional regulator
MRDICTEAGLSAGAVYNYFRSKDEIVVAVAACGRQSTKGLLHAIETPADAVGALQRLVEVLLAMLDTPASVDSSRLDLRLWAEAVDTPRLQQLFREARDNAVAPFAEIVRRGQEIEEVTDRLDADATARSLVSLMIGLQVQKAIDPETSAASCAPSIKALLEGTFPDARKDAP